MAFPEPDQDLIFPFDSDEVFQGLTINESTESPASPAGSESGSSTPTIRPPAILPTLSDTTELPPTGAESSNSQVSGLIFHDTSTGPVGPTAGESDTSVSIIQPSDSLLSTAETAIASANAPSTLNPPRPQSYQHPTILADMASEEFETFTSGNEDIVTTVNFNYYGTRQVLGSSDKTIKVFDEKNEVWTLVDSWRAHDATVSDVSFKLSI